MQMPALRGIVIGIFLLCCLPPVRAQQEIRISGKVTDTLGQPIELVNVVLKDMSQKGTTTNENGAFFLSVPANQEVVLLFSCVGYGLL